MFNKTILVGNLTKDPELRYTPSGTPVTSFSIAVNSKTKQNDEWKDETLFIEIVTFARQAETCGEYLNKGSRVLVEGRLKESRWEAEGQQKSKLQVIAQVVKFLSKKNGANDSEVSESTTDSQNTESSSEPF